MKAAVYKEYGNSEVLRIEQRDNPVPGENEVMVRVMASSVNFGDRIARNFSNLTFNEFNMPAIFFWLARVAFGFNTPKKETLGNEFAGIIEAVGKNVKKFQKGDPVFGYTGEKMGCYAQYICVAENGYIALKPGNISFEEAAGIPYGALMAMNILKKADIQTGYSILIIGASGGIGSAMVQLLKQKNAEVTGVCGRGRMEYVKAIGADRVIDYTTENIIDTTEKFNVVIDILGRNSFSKIKPLLKKNGLYLPVSFKAGKLMQMFWTKLFCNKKIICVLAVPAKEDMQTVAGWVGSGKLKCLPDKTFPLENISDAHRYAESGDRRGCILIKID